jgi:leucine dehydrogenase
MSLLFDRGDPGARYEKLIALQDRRIGLRALIAVHSTRRGPAFGGIRRRHYADDGAALVDVLALAEAMSRKCALAGLPAGGAKTVVLQPARSRPAWSACYAAIGRAVDELGGRYVCGPDVGTSSADLDRVRAHTRWVNPAGNDPAASTAAGVLASMRAVLAHLDLDPGPRIRVAVQGLGAVGLALVRGLRALGIVVCGADPRPLACEAARKEGVEVVDPSRIADIPCDVLAPCALGGVLSVATVQRLRCRAVCGSANNQLADRDAAAAMLQRGIVHVPDVLASAGAVIEGVITMTEGTDSTARDRVQATIEALQATTQRVLDEARGSGRAPVTVAHALADAAIGDGAASNAREP